MVTQILLVLMAAAEVAMGLLVLRETRRRMRAELLAQKLFEAWWNATASGTPWQRSAANDVPRPEFRQ